MAPSFILLRIGSTWTANAGTLTRAVVEADDINHPAFKLRFNGLVPF